jgi:hypothetical protein
MHINSQYRNYRQITFSSKRKQHGRVRKKPKPVNTGVNLSGFTAFANGFKGIALDIFLFRSRKAAHDKQQRDKHQSN